jgi:hypothetical protein
MPAANAEAMSLHLAAIGSKVAPGSHAALVLDGAGYHIAAALTIPDDIILIPLPPYAPELSWKMSGNICVATNSPSPSSKTTTTSSIQAARLGTSSPMTANVRIRHHPIMDNSQSLRPVVLKSNCARAEREVTFWVEHISED